MKFDITKLFAVTALSTVCALGISGCSAKTETETKEAVDAAAETMKESAEAGKAAGAVEDAAADVKEAAEGDAK